MSGPTQLGGAVVAEAGRCPVCKARFRAEPLCSRCGADLAPLMTLSLQAWRLRKNARQALWEGDFPLATELAGRAQQAQRTTAGESILAVGRALDREWRIRQIVGSL